MATITLKGNPFHTNGDVPATGATLADVTLTSGGLEDTQLSKFSGTRILNIFPSIDTPVCSASVRKFNEKAAAIDGVTVLNISNDLPFAMNRFCGAEGIEGVHVLSGFRSDASKELGFEITDGPFKGLFARAVVILDGAGVVKYVELVPEIAQEPDYDAAIAALS
ncbi:thiol peroxidase [Microvenator marinus]|uniref:Thiol peroxidase n=1 Tax=Microvenator marinus TaxID=2600177 RepID=A0A5B8XSU4_9DELT|nr:thiol peroxidase [Microvenator marinus]QED27123.1 thiol peroxidase [Microvenator marinus]